MIEIPPTWTVAEGDTLTSISERLWTALVAELNGLEDPDVIVSGERLLFPASGAALWVLVSDGDTLTSLTGAHLWPSLFLANQDVLGDPGFLQVGQALRVPRLALAVG